LVELIASSYLKTNISFRKSTTFNTIYPYVYSGVTDVADVVGQYVLYPNPAGEEVFITGGNESATTIIISDITGKVEMKDNIIISAGVPYKLDISSLSSVLHIATFISGDSRETHRLMVTPYK
jgi:hypothetical protein